MKNMGKNILDDNSSSKELKTNERKITSEPRSILKFYRENTSIILINEKSFKEWLASQYLANSINDKFIATENSIENGYMIIDKQTYKVLFDNGEYILKNIFNCDIIQLKNNSNIGVFVDEIWSNKKVQKNPKRRFD